MSGRLGIDFGTSNTVVTVWNHAVNDSNTLALDDFARIQDAGQQRIFSIPSLIHYGADFKYSIGNQVLQQNLYHSQRTFQWMKRYICRRSPVERLLDGRRITYFDAGSRFLASILSSAVAAIDLQDEEVGITVPVEAYEDYSEWLANVVLESGMPRFRLLDEPSAAALGYGTDVAPDDVYCVFDFGGGTLDVAIVVLTETDSDQGQHCRILGKAGLDMGGTAIDEWLFNEVVKRNRLAESEEELKAISRLLLVECEVLKEKLSFVERSELTVMNPLSGKLIHAEMSQSELEDILDKHDAFAEIDRTIRRAMKTAGQRGFDQESIETVFLVGGGSQIPSVQRLLKRIFGKERVLMDRPLDAVSRGAAALVAGRGFRDYIQHEYAIRYVRPDNGKYDYRPIVRRGTPYPTSGPVAKLTIKASFDGQKKLGIPIFEIGSRSSAHAPHFELFFDEEGAARVHALDSADRLRYNSFWINEAAPTFLNADPPAAKGEPRFRLEFGIDGNRRLLITAFDLQKNLAVLVDFPAAKLI